MKLDISSVLREAGAVETFRFEKERIDPVDPISETEYIGPIIFQGTIRHTGKEARLQLLGTVETKARTACTRCATRFEHAVRAEVDVVFAPDRDEEPTVDQGVGFGEDSPADYPLTGPILDLGEVARDAILLALPMQVLCSEGCKGICPVCGANRNEDTCACEESDNGAGSPFDILKKLL
ncbi:MAG: YceD family protein [Fastidiosipilaceae bacterium]|jgi:uncharacterized protein